MTMDPAIKAKQEEYAARPYTVCIDARRSHVELPGGVEVAAREFIGDSMHSYY